MFNFPYYFSFRDWKFYEHTPKLKTMWSDLKPINLEKIQTIAFPDQDYFHEEFAKYQIVLHHTVSGDGVEGDIKTWEGEPGIATCIIVDRAGTPWQLFSSKYWAYHLGVSSNNHYLHKHSIGVEIDNWGWLIKGDGTAKQFGKNADGTPKMIQTAFGKYYTCYGNSVAVPIQEYPNGFRGYNYYEKYSEAQIRTVGELILYWKLKYKIPVTYNSDMWDVSQRALNGEPGIWTHVSYQPPQVKTDCHPQPELIEMLKILDTL